MKKPPRAIITGIKTVETLKDNIIKRWESKEDLTDRKKHNRIKKDILELEELEKNNNFLKSATINIIWKKSIYGMNPHLEVRYETINGIHNYKDKYTVSGCGYDKESSVIANMLNDIFLNLLIHNLDKILKYKNDNKLPYGIRFYKNNGCLPKFEGGIGISCYNEIFDFLGYEFKKVSSGKTFDVYAINIK
jgi:hypothetical protein